MSRLPTTSAPGQAAVGARPLSATTAMPLGPAVTVTAAGALFAAYVALASRGARIEQLAVVFALVTAGVVAAWLVAGGGLSGAFDPAARAERLSQQALPFVALLPAGVLLPEFASGHPGSGRVALVLGTCLLVLAVVRLHVAGRMAAVVAWVEANAGRLLAAIVVVHLVATTALVVVRHLYYNAFLGEDTAYYNQIFWSTVNGEFFRGSLTQARYTNPPIHSEFGAHNSPIIFLLLPAYWAHPSFYTLLAVRNVALTLSAVPLFFLATPRLGRAVALGLAVVHLLGPNLVAQSINAFYPMQFAVLCLPLAFLAFERARFGWFLAAFVLLLSVREELALTAVLFAGYALVRRRSWRWIATPALLGVAWWYVSTNLVMSHSRIALEDLDEFYRAFPDGFRGAAGTLLRHPVQFLSMIATTENVAYLYQLAKWSAGLALATPAIVFVAPTALINVLVGSFWNTTTMTTMHYSAVAAVGVSVALVYGLGNVARLHHLFRIDARSFAVVLVLLLAPQVVLGIKDVLAYSGAHQKTLADDLRPRAYHGTLERIVREIETTPGAAVAAPNDVLPQLSQRSRLYNTGRLWRYGNPELDYIMVDADLDRFDRGERHRARYRELIAAIQADPANCLVIDEQDFRLYRRQQSQHCAKR